MREYGKRKLGMHKDFFFIVNDDPYLAKIKSSVSMDTPISNDCFIDFPGTSEFAHTFIGNTHRTVATLPSRISELALDQEIRTFMYDFYNYHGEFLAQLVLFISLDQSPAINSSEVDAIVNLFLYEILPTYIVGEKENLDTFKQKFCQVFISHFSSQETFKKIARYLSVTCIINLTASPKNDKGDYTTLIANIGKHCVKHIKTSGTNIIHPAKKQRLDIFFSKENPEISLTIKNYQENEILQIQSHSDLLTEKEEKLEEKICFSHYLKKIGENLRKQAEQQRSQVFHSWQLPATKVWLVLIRYLWIFQKRLDDQSYQHQKPLDPIYARLKECNFFCTSLINTWSLEKALFIAQGITSEPIEIPLKDLKEIKMQWQKAIISAADYKLKSEFLKEVKHKPSINWLQTFHNQNPEAKVLSGGPIGLLCLVPINHARKSSSYLTTPLLKEMQESLNRRTIQWTTNPIENRVLVTYLPPTTQEQLTLDTVREFDYLGEGKYRGHLSVIYSPRYVEKKGWQADSLTQREIILNALSSKIYNNLEYFSGCNNTEAVLKLEKFLASMLTNSPFKESKASILFCLKTTVDGDAYRFLVSVGNCMALSCKNDIVTTHIGSMYDEKDSPILLSSLNEAKSLIPFITQRQKYSPQLAIVKDSKEDILLISGRVVPRQAMRRMVALMPKPGLLTYELDIKASGLNEIATVLRHHRQQFLELIHNPSTISAWKKLEHLLNSNSAHLIDDHKHQIFISQQQLANNSSTMAELIKEFAILVTYITPPTDQLLLTEEESTSVQRLWDMATSELQKLPKEHKTNATQMPISWRQIRKNYFLYFQGISDPIAMLEATCLLTPIPLFEFIHALAQQFLSSITSGSKEAKEIQTFTHIACTLKDEKLILKASGLKLEAIANQNFGEITQSFWRQLVGLLIILYLPQLRNQLEVNIYQIIAEIKQLSQQDSINPVRLLSRKVLSNQQNIISTPWATPLVS